MEKRIIGSADFLNFLPVCGKLKNQPSGEISFYRGRNTFHDLPAGGNPEDFPAELFPAGSVQNSHGDILFRLCRIQDLQFVGHSLRSLMRKHKIQYRHGDLFLFAAQEQRGGTRIGKNKLAASGGDSPECPFGGKNEDRLKPPEELFRQGEFQTVNPVQITEIEQSQTAGIRCVQKCRLNFGLSECHRFNFIPGVTDNFHQTVPQMDDSRDFVGDEFPYQLEAQSVLIGIGDVGNSLVRPPASVVHPLVNNHFRKTVTVSRDIPPEI